MKKHPKLFRALFDLTANDERIPTDSDLDEKIKILGFQMHYIWPLLGYIIKKKLSFFFLYKWKILLKKGLYAAIVLTLIYFAWIKVARPIFIIKQQTEFVAKIHDDLIKSPIPKENLLFMNTLSLLESSGDYKAKNGQYWGAFQLGFMARSEVGLSSMDLEMFLNDFDIQNLAMNRYMKKNYEYLKNIITKYKIPKRGGIRIGNNLVTVSGLLASAHLVGASAAINFVRSNGKDVEEDGNGVPLTKYLQLNGFDLIFEK